MAEPFVFKEAMLDGLVDAQMALSSDGMILYLDAAAEAMFGFAPDEVVGHPVQEFGALASGVADLERRLLQLVRTGEPLSYETQLRTRRGIPLIIDVGMKATGAGDCRCFITTCPTRSNTPPTAAE